MSFEILGGENVVALAPDTRERWLGRFVDLLRPTFTEAGYELPPTVHVSVGFPSTGGLCRRKKVLGECWDPSVSQDGASQIFLNPTLDPGDFGHVLVHELLHAVLWTDGDAKKIGHGPKFKKGCRKLDLAGKPTATVAGEQLQARLDAIALQLGPCPHPTLTPALKEKKTKNSPSLACECVPPRILRGSKADIEKGPATCGVCSAEFHVQAPEGDEDDDGDEDHGDAPDLPPMEVTPTDDPDQKPLFPGGGDAPQA